MKITEITIKNYKSFDNKRIYGLSNINMIYGYNNSGKSNILKFIELIFRRKKTQGEEIQYLDANGNKVTAPPELGNFWSGMVQNVPYIFKDNNRNNEIDFEVIISIDKEELENMIGTQIFGLLRERFFNNQHSFLTLCIRGQFISRNFYDTEMKLVNVELNRNKIYTNDSPAIYFETITDEASPLRTDGYLIFNSLMSLFNDYVLLLDNNRYFTKENDNDNKTLTALNFKNWLFKKSLNNEAFESYTDLIKFVKEFRVSSNSSDLKHTESNSPLKEMNIGFTKNDQELEIMLENSIGKRLPIGNFGTGIQQILYIYSAIYNSNAKLILIEELELNLSPRYQGELLTNLVSLIDSGKISLVAFTTHSKYFNYRADFSIYEVSINENGVSSVSKQNAVRRGFFNTRNLG